MKLFLKSLNRLPIFERLRGARCVIQKYTFYAPVQQRNTNLDEELSPDSKSANCLKNSN